MLSFSPLRFGLFALGLSLLGACASSPTTESPQVAASPKDQTPNQGKATSLKAQIQGLNPNTKVFLDRRSFETLDVLGDKIPDEQGQLTWDFSVSEAGIYRLRIQEQVIWLLLEGGEQLEIQAQYGTNPLQYQVKGSTLSAELQKWVNSTEVEAVARYVRETPDDQALVKLYLLDRLPIPQYLEDIKKVVADMKNRYPNTNLAKGLETRVLQIEAQFNRASVALGKAVPNIKLPDPNGKDLSLADLKGKVVLIDFWASWCRPCRMENPNVVRIYKAFKDKGFTVYSVSLDGLDDRQQLALGNDAQQLQNALQRQRQLWTNAIKDDALEWPYHVSELRSWSSAVAQLYGIDAIPRTFLIDRQGVLRYVNLRGKELEDKVKELVG